MIKLKDLLEKKSGVGKIIGYHKTPDYGKQWQGQKLKDRPLNFNPAYGTGGDYGEDVAGAGEYLNTNWNKLRDKEKLSALDDYVNDLSYDIEDQYSWLEDGDESTAASIQQLEIDRDKAHALATEIQKRRLAKQANKGRKNPGGAMLKAVRVRDRYGAPGIGYMESVSSNKNILNEVGAAQYHKKFLKNIDKAEQNLHKHIHLYKNFLNSQGLKDAANEFGSKYVTIVGKFTHWVKTSWTRALRKMI